MNISTTQHQQHRPLPVRAVNMAPECHARSLRRPVLIGLAGVVLFMVSILRLAWLNKSAAEAVAVRAARIERQEGIDKQVYLSAHAVTHKKLERIQKTQEHLERDVNQLKDIETGR